MRNFFFLCPEKKFMFLSISKNACTTLKSLLFRLSYGRDFESGRNSGVHEFWGFSEKPGRVVERGDTAGLSAFADYTRFTVYRDPVDRFLATYRNKVLFSTEPHVFFARSGLTNIGLNAFIDAVEEVLDLENPLLIDEHIRPQYLQYRRSEVDHVVDIGNLDKYLESVYGITDVPRENRSIGPEINPTPSQVKRIRELYVCDYELVPGLFAP